MGVVRKTPLPELASLRDTLPLTEVLKEQVADSRSAIEAILQGDDDRALLIVGPCSAWPDTAVLAYADKLAALAREVQAKVCIVMRVYTQKPRTTKGWAGVVVQPDPFKKPDIRAGATYARTMMLAVLERGLPVADELLFTHKAVWLGDLLSWAAIGARSAEDQEHRVFASGLSMPVGMKNPTSGDIGIAINSVISAQSPHTYFGEDAEIETSGNAHAHLVLRGGSDGPNYNHSILANLKERLTTADIKNPAVLIDASHDNAIREGSKDFRAQTDVVDDVLSMRAQGVAGAELTKGFLVESFLEEGAQALGSCTAATVNKEGLSITDPCLGWDDTEKLVRKVATEW